MNIEVQPDQFINWNKIKDISIVSVESDEGRRHVIVKYENESTLTDYGRVTEEWETYLRNQLQVSSRKGAGFG